MAMQIDVKEVRIPVPWGFIAAKSWGNPLGYPILAVHGTMDNAASFDNLAPLLPGNFLFMAIDLPGHGLSSPFPDGLPYLFMDLVLSVKRIVDYFKWEALHYVGHSLGGIIGSFFAAMYPELVKKLVMLDVVKPPTNPMSVHSDLLRASYEGFLKTERKRSESTTPLYTEEEIFEAMVSKRANPLSTKSAKSLLSRSLRPRGDGMFTLVVDQRIKAMTFVPLTEEQLCEMLSSLQCELLVVQAKESKAFFQLGGGPAILEVFKDSCSYFQLITVDGNHGVHMDHPDRVAPVLTKFLLRSSL